MLRAYGYYILMEVLSMKLFNKIMVAVLFGAAFMGSMEAVEKKTLFAQAQELKEKDTNLTISEALAAVTGIDAYTFYNAAADNSYEVTEEIANKVIAENSGSALKTIAGFGVGLGALAGSAFVLYKKGLKNNETVNKVVNGVVSFVKGLVTKKEVKQPEVKKSLFSRILKK